MIRHKALPFLVTASICLVGFQNDDRDQSAPSFEFEQPRSGPVVRIHRAGSIQTYSNQQLAQSGWFRRACPHLTIDTHAEVHIGANHLCVVKPVPSELLLGLKRPIPHELLTARTFQLVPGIGKKLSQRIDLWRQSGTAQSLCDVAQVRGIGPRLATRIRQLLAPDLICP
ncbi:MAG: hypothetical protein CMH54_05320 [Myxococcales bacterium]|nr:hypothetical protein [Myxococcales bacterium]